MRSFPVSPDQSQAAHDTFLYDDVAIYVVSMRFCIDGELPRAG